ncbi:MAG: hypothetical protein HZA01_01160, partial [Nitrospinae bacterium]|nr:hypothetical protein [Nitrospinota bacterium]
HLSTALAPIHRKATIDRVKRRLKEKNDKDWTLVGTSCVEAGLDFSFRTAARELCSLISAIQTAGRANRSGEFGASELWGFKIRAGELLREHPAFKTSAQVLADIYREQKVSPEFCMEAMRREIRSRNHGRCEDDSIIKAEFKKDFPEVERQFKVISSNTITVIVDVDLLNRLSDREKRKEVKFQEIQQKAVNIYTTKKELYGIAPLDGFNELFRWDLAYNHFLGYMAGVLEMENFSDNCCI